MNDAPTMLAKCQQLTRLETRTKECNICASVRVLKTRTRSESERWESLRMHHRPTMIPLVERFEQEHIRCDPKDGELFPSRVKPEEILVEARSDSDAQIDRQTWV